MSKKKKKQNRGQGVKENYGRHFYLTTRQTFLVQSSPKREASQVDSNHFLSCTPDTILSARVSSLSLNAIGPLG